MAKLMKVCIGNNQRIDSWKYTSAETLDRNKTGASNVKFREISVGKAIWDLELIFGTFAVKFFAYLPLLGFLDT